MFPNLKNASQLYPLVHTKYHKMGIFVVVQCYNEDIVKLVFSKVKII